MVDDSVVNEKESTIELTLTTCCDLYGFPIEKLYRHAIKFYKDKEKNGELQLDYRIRLQFMAYFKQAKYGAFKEDIADCGWFDLVGNDSRTVWKKLGALSIEEAMLEFVRLLDIVCPTTFKPHIKELQKLESPKIVLGQAQVNKISNIVNESSFESQEVLQRYQEQRQLIQEALNKQTYHQFLAYTQQTFPGEPEKQKLLIKELQEQHYEQYMSQVYAQQAQAQAASILKNSPSLSNSKSNVATSANALTALDGLSTVSITSSQSSDLTTDDSEANPQAPDAYLQQGLERPPHNLRSKNKVKLVNEAGEESAAADDDNTSDVSDEEASTLDDAPANSKIAPASLWNSKNIQEFKETIRKEGVEGILKIGHGETITVRVPTHEEGYCLYWEFATDYYDIGFGLFFEWTIAENNQVTVHVSESSDEDYDEELAANANGGPNDVESAASGECNQQNNYLQGRKNDPNKPHTDEVIPIYRRDCHEQVLAGSHLYPGRGVYLLKFDNSYSLWRSKTLYYRVFYSK